MKTIDVWQLNQIYEGGIGLEFKKNSPKLDELLDQITPENKHSELDLGSEGEELL